jgi:hypothetical protein
MEEKTFSGDAKSSKICVMVHCTIIIDRSLAELTKQPKTRRRDSFHKAGATRDFQ